MTKIIKEKINDVNYVILVRLFLIAVFIIFGLYLYFLATTVSAAVESKNNTKNIQAISREYQELENQYFSLLEKINIDYARELGFVDQPQKIDYIVRQAAVAYGKGF